MTDNQLPPLTKLSTWIPVDETTLIDAGLGTPEMIARDKAASAATRRRLAARPWRVKLAERRRRLAGRLVGDVALRMLAEHERLHPHFHIGCAFCNELDRRREP